MSTASTTDLPPPSYGSPLAAGPTTNGWQPPPPRSVIYINNSIPSSSYRIIPTPNADISAVRFLATTSSPPITFVNIYNPPDSLATLPILKVFLQSLQEEHPTSELVILGGFNLHHPMGAPPRRNAQHESQSDELLVFLAVHGASLQSQPHVLTFRNIRGHQSTIDLVFTTPGVKEKYVQCETVEDSDYDLGSDHAPILRIISADIPAQAPRPRRQYDKTDWGEARAALAELIRAKWKKPRNLRTDIVRAVTLLTELIDEILKQFVPEVTPSRYSKPWWDDAILKDLKKKYKAAKRRAKRTQGD